MASANRNDLIQYVQRRLACTRTEASAALEAVLAGVKSHLQDSDRVSFSGFGTFEAYERGPLRRYDMNAKVIRVLPPRPRIRFTPSPKLLKAVTDASE